MERFPRGGKRLRTVEGSSDWGEAIDDKRAMGGAIGDNRSTLGGVRKSGNSIRVLG